MSLPRLPAWPRLLGLCERLGNGLGAALRVLERASHRGLFRFAVFATYALIVTWPLLAQAALVNQFRDAQLLGTYERDAVHAVRDFTSWPFWDPYLCGGVYALGSPQTRFASPTFLLSLLFGADRAEPLLGFGFVLVGLEGTFRWVRRFSKGGLAALLAAPLFAASGTFAAAPFLGWINFYGFALLPWVLLGWQDALGGRTRGALLAAGAWAFMVGFGGTYAAPMTALACGLVALRAAITCRDRTRARALVAGALLTSMLAAGLGAVRLWPLTETLLAAPRTLGGHPSRTLEELWRALFSATRIKSGNLAGADMYTLGSWFFAPAIVACLLRPRRAAFLALLAGLALWMATGEATSWSLFAALRVLPVFGALRYPERYLVFVALSSSGLAALGLRQLMVRARRAQTPLAAAGWNVAAAVTALLLCCNASYLASNHHLIAHRRLLGPPPATDTRPFRQTRGNRWVLSTFPAMERGSLQCWDAYPVPMSDALRADLPREELWSSAGGGSATRIGWAPDRLSFRIQAPLEGVLRINQNFHPGWRTNSGRVFSDEGLLAVALPAGDHEVRLRFRPRSGFGGLAVSLASLAAALALLLATRPGVSRATRWASVLAPSVWLLCLGPILVFGAALVFVHEPARPPTVVTSPSGAPLLVAPPPAAARAATAVGRSLTLDGAEASLADPEWGARLVRVSLWWRRTGPLSHAPVRVRVALRTTAGTLVEESHELVSAWLPLHRLPLGVSVRDEVFIALPPHSSADSSPALAEVLVEVTDSTGISLGDGRRPVLSHVPLP